MPEWLIYFANIDLPDWVSTLVFAWFPDNIIFPFLFLAFMLKCFLISFYCAVVYLGIRLVKRLRGQRMRIRTRYYSWYALLFSIPLSGFAFSSAIKLPFYDLFLGSISMEFSEINAITDQELHAILNLTKMARLLRPILFYLTVIWLLVIVRKCLRQIVLNKKLRQQMNKQAPFVDPDNLKQKAAHEFRLRADKIQVIAAEFVHSPVSYGVFKRTILLPYDYATRYTPSELYLLLLHEMGHIKNHDTLKIQLLSIAECFIWVLRPMRKGFIRDSEILCDNRVLGVLKDSRDAYGEMIIRECSEKHLVKGLGFSDSFHTIKSRVESIYSHKPEKHHVAAIAIAAVLLLASYTVYAANVPADWLTTSPTANEIDDLLVYYIDEESGEEYSESLFSLAQSPSPDGELMRYSNGESQELRHVYRYDAGQLQVDRYALYQYLLPFIDDGLQVTGVAVKMYGVYGMNTVRDSLFWNGTSGSGNECFRTYEIDIGALTQATQTDRYTIFICEMCTEERVYQFVAHWF